MLIRLAVIERSRITHLVTSRVVYFADGLDLVANLRETVLKVDEALHRFFKLLVDMRDVCIKCTVDALSVVLWKRFKYEI